MAKDAKGHGSDGKGGAMDKRADRLAKNAVIRAANQARGAKSSPYSPSTTQIMRGTSDSGGQPMSSNAAAAQSLMSGLKSTQAPVHDAMAFRAGRAADNAALKQRSKEFSAHLDDQTYAGTGPKPAHWK